MTNQEVRSHLRKGEQAVNVLKKLGWTYRFGNWDAPEVTPEHAMLEPIIKALAELAVLREKPQDALKSGDRFVILHLPPTHLAISKNCPEWRNRVFRVGEVDMDSDRGPVVRFGLSAPATRGYWLPLTAIQKVPSNADF